MTIVDRLLEMIDDALRLRKPRIVEIESERYSIVGDIHADFQTLNFIERKAIYPTVFLGDYADRGENPLEVYEMLIQGYLNGDFVLIRGNHESDEAFPHDLPARLMSVEGGEVVYSALKRFWDVLPYCAIINGDVFAVHGGIYTKACRIESYGVILRELKSESALEELVWNDPWENEYCTFNFERGIGFLFGKRATERFASDLGLKVIVRSHQPYKVLKAEQDGMVVTVGSTRVYGTPFAFLNVEGEFRDGHELIRKYGYIFS